MTSPGLRRNIAGAGFFGSIKGYDEMVGDAKATELSGITTPDDKTVVIQLTRPDATFLHVMAINFSYAVPKEEVDKFGADFEAGIRTAYLRTGIVLARGGGVLGKLLPLFRLGLGGRDASSSGRSISRGMLTAAAVRFGCGSVLAARSRAWVGLLDRLAAAPKRWSDASIDLEPI